MSEKKTNTAAKTAPETGAVKTTAKENATAENGGFCIYLGPTITGVIQKGTIYGKPKDKVLSELSETIKKYPLIASLIVPDKKISEARKNVQTPGNILYVNYHKMLSGQN